MNKTQNISFSTFEQFTENLQYSNNCIILSEKTIYTLYPQLFQTNSPRLILDINEKNKSLATAESIWNFFVQNKITKTHTVFIIGGGVLHDVALFACSVFKRGLQVVSVPTTLLSMVDASIGGKNAINYQYIKNLIGTIYLPSQNIIIPDFLKTLSQQELLSGWAEIIKIALVTDKHFYTTITQQMNHSLTPTFSLIEKSIQLKLHIIQQDLNDEGIRQLLNFGHTIAHAIEAIYDEENKYIPHGIAVAQGMMIEAYLSHYLNILPYEQFQEILSHLKKHYPLPPINQNLSVHKILTKIIQDKKNTHQHIQFTLLENIGKGKIKISANNNQIETALNLFCTQLF